MATLLNPSPLTPKTGTVWNEGDVKTVAQSQHGLLRRGQALELGGTQAEIEWRLQSKRLDQLHPGVYHLDAITPTWNTEVLAGVFAAGPDAAASHRTAGVLYELDAVYGLVIEVTVPFNEEPEPRQVVVHRTRRPTPVSVVAGIPVTSIERTLLDLAPVIGQRNLYKATRSAVHKNLTTPEKLDQAIRLFGGRGVKGTRAARGAFRSVADDESESVAEINLAALLDHPGIPRPVQQLRVRLFTTENAYPDFAWPDRMRIVEADGFGAHGTPDRFESDLRRQNRLMELGWEIRRFTAKEIREEPDRVQLEVIRFVNKPFCAG